MRGTHACPARAEFAQFPDSTDTLQGMNRKQVVSPCLYVQGWQGKARETHCCGHSPCSRSLYCFKYPGFQVKSNASRSFQQCLACPQTQPSCCVWVNNLCHIVWMFAALRSAIGDPFQQKYLSAPCSSC